LRQSRQWQRPTRLASPDVEIRTWPHTQPASRVLDVSSDILECLVFAEIETQQRSSFQQNERSLLRVP
jgi:hypothetical protein